ncbi:MAG: LEA type 2 family protein [Syntrophales bacterium]|nr:LEA type 2 family protein [Syntrophales bacterium]
MSRYLRMIFVLVILCLHCACLDRIVEKPAFTLKNVSLTLHSMKELKARLTVEVQNPNGYSLSFRSLEYRFALENREAAQGCYAEAFEVPPQSAREITIPLTMELDGMGSPLKSFLMGRDIPYKIEGTVHLKILWGSLALPFLKEGSFNIKS